MVTGCCILTALISLFTYWQTGWPLTSGMTPSEVAPRGSSGSLTRGTGIRSLGSPHRPLWSPSPFCMPPTIRVRMVIGEDHHDELCRRHPRQG